MSLIFKVIKTKLKLGEFDPYVAIGRPWRIQISQDVSCSHSEQLLVMRGFKTETDANAAIKLLKPALDESLAMRSK